jgi:hypothetical protein
VGSLAGTVDNCSNDEQQKCETDEWDTRQRNKIEDTLLRLLISVSNTSKQVDLCSISVTLQNEREVFVDRRLKFKWAAA